MKLEMSKEWFRHKVALEQDVDVGAGSLAAMPTAESDEHSPDDARLAFGTLVHLMRRRRVMSMEKLADDADVDLSEILNIEHNFHYRPEPRTVHQLAQVFSLPVRCLMQLSGNMQAKDSELGHAAVRFAARSDSLEHLSSQEQAVLEEFVSYLSKE